MLGGRCSEARCSEEEDISTTTRCLKAAVKEVEKKSVTRIQKKLCMP